MKQKTKIGFVSLGCPKNQLDTEVMLHELMTAGYELTGEENEADIIIVNTCAFIESAKRESIDNILDVAWFKKNGHLRGIIVTGCLAQRYREEVTKELPEVDAVLGTGSIHNIVEAVKAVDEKTADGAGNGSLLYSSFLDTSECALGGDRVVTTSDHSAYIKIAEGCDNRCSYCVIPSLRGGYRSRPAEDIVKEAQTLEGLGVKELIIIAQDTTRYGMDLYGRYELPRLIRAVTDGTKIPWIRLLYCYPDKITDELVEEIRSNDRVVKYIDLPIQHISDPILDRMNRHGGSETIKDAISRLRKAVPGIVIRTTAIAGFPGETEEDFELLCSFVRETRFERFGVFAYSREEGTPAAEMEGQIDEQTKQDRCDRLMAIQLEITAELNAASVGRDIKVLCEGYDAVSGSYFGRSAADAPEIDGKIYFTSDRKIKDGRFVNVKITETLDYDLIGKATV